MSLILIIIFKKIIKFRNSKAHEEINDGKIVLEKFEEKFEEVIDFFQIFRRF